MTPEEILAEVDASIERHIDEIEMLAEAVRLQIHNGTRYSAAPITHVAQLPHDGELVSPDNLSASYPNEPISLETLGATTDEFTRWAATIFRYDRGGVVGWGLTINVEIGGATWERTINRGEAEFDFFNRGWYVSKEGEGDKE